MSANLNESETVRELRKNLIKYEVMVRNARLIIELQAARINMLCNAIDSMRVAGGKDEFQAAFDLAKEEAERARYDYQKD